MAIEPRGISPALSSSHSALPHSPPPTRFFGYKSGQVISCLRDVKAQVTKPCKQQLFKVMMDVSGRGEGAGRSPVRGGKGGRGMMDVSGSPGGWGGGGQRAFTPARQWGARQGAEDSHLVLYSPPRQAAAIVLYAT